METDGGVKTSGCLFLKTVTCAQSVQLIVVRPWACFHLPAVSEPSQKLASAMGASSKFTLKGRGKLLIL